MVDFIYGRSGTGKSTEVLLRAEKSARDGKHVYIIVPDRDAVSTERLASELHNAGNIDVVTFRRLCNYIFRSLGGICENYISTGAKKLIMHSVLEKLSDELAEYGKISKTDLSMTETLVSARGEMMRNLISPSDLDMASEKLSGKTAKKASDLGKIFSAFDAELSRDYKDPDGMLSAAEKRVLGSGFFSDSEIYIDGFTAFTAQQ
ncbi:MAG: hypothetical protein KBS59_07785, partial [Clostridiales bacterium]|nr:hypothetical protein [Clostridiales bacterium]